MEVIYEIPGEFRITFVPSFASWAGGAASTRRTPFVLNYRAPGSEEFSPAEHVELTNELFSAFLSISPDNTAAFETLFKYVGPEVQMSEGMRRCLLTAPKSLLEYVTERKNEAAAFQNPWRDVEKEQAPYGVDFLVVVPNPLHPNRKQPYYDRLIGYCNPDGWFDSFNHERIDPDYFQALPASPRPKEYS